MTNQVSFSKLEAGGGGELDRRRADEQHVAAVGQHRPRGADRVAHAAHGRHRAGGARRAVHDRGVELHAPVLGERRAATGVELRVVLEHHDGGLDRVERRAAGRQHRMAGLDRGRRARAHPLGPLGVGDRAPAPPWTTIAISSIGWDPTSPH